MFKKERTKLRSNIHTLQLNLKLLNLSKSTTEAAIVEKNSSLLHNALLLHSVEDFRWDVRENYIYLSVINYGYEYFKKNIDEELNSIRSIFSDTTNKYMSEFFNRPKNSKSLKAMGLMASKSSGIVKFDVIRPPWLK